MEDLPPGSASASSSMAASYDLDALGSGTMRYEHDWLARRGAHDRPVHPPQAEAKAAEHIAKDGKYYRRRGAYWTDAETHCPGRTRQLHGLNTDKAQRVHDAAVRQRAQADGAMAARRRRAVRRARAAQRQRFHQRRVDNFDAAAAGTQKHGVPADTSGFPAAPPPGPGSATPASRAKHRGPVAKDQGFFRRRGNLWSDLAHCPSERLHYVVRPSTVRADFAAAEHIEGAVRRDREAQAARAARQRHRAKGIRANFAARRQSNERRHRGLSGDAPVGQRQRQQPEKQQPEKQQPEKQQPEKQQQQPEQHQQQRQETGSVRGSREEQLSQPKKALPDRKPYTGPEFNGLLSLDDRLLERLKDTSSGGGVKQRQLQMQRQRQTQQMEALAVEDSRSPTRALLDGLQVGGRHRERPTTRAARRAAAQRAERTRQEALRDMEEFDATWGRQRGRHEDEELQLEATYFPGLRLNQELECSPSFHLQPDTASCCGPAQLHLGGLNNNNREAAAGGSILTSDEGTTAMLSVTSTRQTVDVEFNVRPAAGAAVDGEPGVAASPQIVLARAASRTMPPQSSSSSASSS